MILMNPCWSGSFVFNDTISSATAFTNGYNLRTKATAAGWDQTSPLIATVTVTSTGVIGSTSTAYPAFDTDTGYASGTQINLIVQAGGYVSGKGGKGGDGSWGTGGTGETGGIGLKARYAITVNNLGTIQGGGGGGAGGGNGWGGGDGGAGWSPGGAGAGAPAGEAPPEGGPGTSGSLTSGGSSSTYGGYGGAPGSGGGGAATVNPGSPGSGGNAIEGNSLITWTNTGTRLVNIVA